MRVSFSRLIIEEEAAGDPVAIRLSRRFSGTPVEFTGDPLGAIERGSGKRDSLILMRRRGAFVKDFPVPGDSPLCGEKYLVTMLNCPYSCTYCYLRSYLDHESMVIFTNTDKLEADIKETLSSARPKLLTTGELGDSLALDHLTGTTAGILDLLSGTDTILDVRTKSDCVDHLLSGGGRGALYPGEEGTCLPGDSMENTRPPGGIFKGKRPPGEMGKGKLLPMEMGTGNRPPISKDNLVITWTLGPEEGIRSEEHGTASLRERLDAMRRVSRAGIRVGIRFDPIIPFYAGSGEYDRLLAGIAGAVDESSIHRFELGILRFPPGLWEIIRRKNPGSALLRGEYVKGRDGKIRLYRPKRVSLYREISGSILLRFPDVPVELSMESRTVWEDSGIEPPPED